MIEKYRENQHISHIVYNEENSGSTFKQWNKGFQLAKGELVWIAESDDKCEPNLLEVLVGGFLKHDNIVVSYCSSKIIDGEGRDKHIPLVGNVSDDFYEGNKFISQDMSWCNSIPNASAVLFRKDIALQIDKQYMNYVAAGDRLFWIELCEHGNVYHSSLPLNYFRKHGDNVTPRCYRNGTTFVEDERINRYLEQKHYLSFMQIVGTRYHYQSMARGIAFDSENIRQDVLRRWSKDGLYNYTLLTCFFKLYNILRYKHGK